MKNIFNNQRIGWILFIMLIAGYSAYWVDNNRDFNTVIFDENNKVRDIEYIATEYHKLFKDTDWKNMPEFKPLSDEDQSLLEESQTMLYSELTKNNLTYMVAVHSDKDLNDIILGQGIDFSINTTNSIEDIITNLKPAFEVLEKAYPKDRESLDNIYTEIPMHFTKYTNQENYQDAKYKKEYINVVENKYIDIKYISIYLSESEYTISISKYIPKEGE